MRLWGTKGLSVRPRCIGTEGFVPNVNQRTINQGALDHKNYTLSHYNNRCCSLIPQNFHFFFQCNFQPVDALVPSWHKFKNSVTVDIRLLYSQPFMNNHFIFLLIINSVTSLLLLQWPTISSSVQAALPCVRDVLN